MPTTMAERWQREVQAAIPHWGQETFLTAKQISQARLVAENRYPVIEDKGDYNPAGMEQKMRPAAQSGRRKGRWVKASSHNMVRAVYPEALGLISVIRETALPYDQETTPVGVLDTLRAVDGLPFFMVLRNDGPLKAYKIPNAAAAASKMVAPLVRFYEGLQLVEFGIGEEPKKRSATFQLITHTEPILEEIFEKGHLLSSISDRACPATPDEIEQVATVLYEKPNGDQLAMQDNLSFSPEEMERIIVFGKALSQIRLLSHLPRRIREAGGLGPLSKIRDGGRLRPIESSDVQKIWDVLERRMNVSLGRQAGPTVLPAAFRSARSRFVSR